MNWLTYLKNSIGIQIFSGVFLLLSLGAFICSSTEKKRVSAGKSEHEIESIATIKCLFIGMLIGFVASVTAGVAQFVIRFGYFSLLQEIGAIFFGFIGAIVGGLVGLLKFRRKQK